jgi:hypothetical protein
MNALANHLNPAHRGSLALAALLTLPLVGTVVATDVLTVLNATISAVLIVGLTILSFLLVFQLSRRVILPQFGVLAWWERLAFLSFTLLLGLGAWWRYPLAEKTLPGATCQILTATLLIFVLLLAVTQPAKTWGGASLLSRFTVPVLFFGIYLCVGLLAFDDYNLSIDENPQRNHGQVMLKHVLSLIAPSASDPRLRELPAVEDYEYSHYGTVLQLPLVAQDLLKYQSAFGPRAWLFRHYVTFAVFFAGVLAFYRLVLEKFQRPWLAVAACVLLVLTPRIFAHSFYNIKDAVFLAAFIFAIYGAFRFWRMPSAVNAVFFGVVLAVAINLRFVAVGLLPLPFIFLGIDAIAEKWEKSRIRAVLGRTALFALATAVTYLICTPASWSNPVYYFLKTVQRFSDFDEWPGTVLYRGEFFYGRDVPWHYLPTWMLITIPLSVLGLFLLGLVPIVARLITQRRRFARDPMREDLGFLGVLVLPVLAAIVMGSTLYDGWRHFFFVYAPLLLVATRGLKFGIEKFRQPGAMPQYLRWAGPVLGLLLVAYQAHLAWWMTKNHPYQMVYYNAALNLVGEREDFDRDYWNLAGLEGLNYILDTDPRQTVTITGNTNFFIPSLLMLPDEERLRLHLENPSLPFDYYIRTYRRDPVPRYKEMDLYYEVIADGMPILTIYKAKPQEEVPEDEEN